MKTIALKTGELLMVDDLDYKACCKFKWYRKVSCSGTLYAIANIARVNGVGGRIYAHKLIMPTSPGIEVDHWDGDGLNCQRHNLRQATEETNAKAFRKKIKGTTSKYRGVSWCRTRQMWRARIEFKDVNRKRTSWCGGYHHSEDVAALAYNDLAEELGFLPEALNIVRTNAAA